MAKVVAYSIPTHDVGADADAGSEYIATAKGSGEVLGAMLLVSETFAGSTTEVFSIFDGAAPATNNSLAGDCTATVTGLGVKGSCLLVPMHGTAKNRKVTKGTKMYLGWDAAGSRSAGGIAAGSLLLVQYDDNDIVG